MALTKDELMAAVDNMPIYKDDYDVIENLLDNAPTNLMATIIEEVANGELYWSDFKRVLADNYADAVTNEIKMQQDIKQHYDLYQSLYQMEHQTTPDKNYVAVKTNTGKASLREKTDAEINRLRDNILYLLSVPNKDDTVLVSSMKKRLYNSIRNGKLLIRDSKNGKYVEHDDAKIIENGEEYQYISPNDIFLFLNNYYIPVDYEHQVLDDVDKNYMRTHNISEDEMKKIKSLAAQYRLLGN